MESMHTLDNIRASLERELEQIVSKRSALGAELARIDGEQQRVQGAIDSLTGNAKTKGNGSRKAVGRGMTVAVIVAAIASYVYASPKGTDAIKVHVLALSRERGCASNGVSGRIERALRDPRFRKGPDGYALASRSESTFEQGKDSAVT